MNDRDKPQSPINAAGVLRARHLLAVFDAQSEARDAACLLDGNQCWIMHGPDDALALSAPQNRAGPLRRIERLAKLLGGETNDAKRYSEHLNSGKTVLAVATTDPDTANRVTATITAAGGYDVTYYRDWALQYMSPRENADHHLPTHAVTNTEDSDS